MGYEKRLPENSNYSKVSFSSTLFFLLLALYFILSYSISYAAQATLTWDPPVDSTEETRYMIHYGTVSGAYSQSIDVGNTTSHTVSNLNDGQRYYFATTAYNHAGQESGYSNEVCNRPPIPTSLPWLMLLLGD
jgi:hypothetical protein